MKMFQKNSSVPNSEKKRVKFRSMQGTINDKNSKILERSLIYLYEVNIHSRVILTQRSHRCHYKQTFPTISAILSIQIPLNLIKIRITNLYPDTDYPI